MFFPTRPAPKKRDDDDWEFVHCAPTKRTASEAKPAAVQSSPQSQEASTQTVFERHSQDTQTELAAIPAPKTASISTQTNAPVIDEAKAPRQRILHCAVGSVVIFAVLEATQCILAPQESGALITSFFRALRLGALFAASMWSESVGKRLVP